MKILFVWPRNSESIFDTTDPINKYYRFFSKILFFRPPLTFSILAALTPKEYTIELAGGAFRDINFDKKYDLVGITSITSCASLTYKIADEFRRRGVPVVLGGYHPTAMPEEAKHAFLFGDEAHICPPLLYMFLNNLKAPAIAKPASIPAPI